MRNGNEDRAHILARFMREDPQAADSVRRTLLTMAESGWSDVSGDLKADLQPFIERSAIFAASRLEPDGAGAQPGRLYGPEDCRDAAREYIDDNLDSLRSGLREAAALVPGAWSVPGFPGPDVDGYGRSGVDMPGSYGSATFAR